MTLGRKVDPGRKHRVEMIALLRAADWSRATGRAGMIISPAAPAGFGVSGERGGALAVFCAPGSNDRPARPRRSTASTPVMRSSSLRSGQSPIEPQ